MPNSIEFYLSRGYDEKTATYFASGRKKIVSVNANDDFTLTLNFDNGEIRLFDMKPILEDGSVFIPFRDINNFRWVNLDDCNSVCWDVDPDIDSEIYWDNKVDLCPDSCYIDSIPHPFE